MSKQNQANNGAKFTKDEQMMVLIYYQGDRLKTISALRSMRLGTGADEVELRGYTDSAIEKLEKMTDREFEEMDFFGM